MGAQAQNVVDNILSQYYSNAPSCDGINTGAPADGDVPRPSSFSWLADTAAAAPFEPPSFSLNKSGTCGKDHNGLDYIYRDVTSLEHCAAKCINGCVAFGYGATGGCRTAVPFGVCGEACSGCTEGLSTDNIYVMTPPSPSPSPAPSGPTPSPAPSGLSPSPAPSGSSPSPLPNGNASSASEQGTCGAIVVLAAAALHRTLM